MSWTESRSRDEWLAEVRRRGERLRRRRRAAVCAAAGIVVLVPAFAMLAVPPPGGEERPLQLAVGGPPSTTGVIDIPLPSIFEGDLIVPTSTTLVPPPPASTGGAGGVASPPPTEVHVRLDAVNGVPSRTDDPVVSTTPPPTTILKGDSVQSSPLLPIPGATTVPSTIPPAYCPVADVRITVSTEKSTYGAGETVRWSSTLENRSSTTCSVSGRAFFHVEDASGKVVGSFAYVANYMVPVRAEPGQVFTNTGSWDQRDCSGSACIQVSAGTYTVVAEWTEAGPYVGRGSFQIAP